MTTKAIHEHAEQLELLMQQRNRQIKTKKIKGFQHKQQFEANDKLDQLEKQTEQLYATLMVEQPPQRQPLQETTAATIKGSGGKGCG